MNLKTMIPKTGTDKLLEIEMQPFHFLEKVNDYYSW